MRKEAVIEDVKEYNREGWNRRADAGDEWSRPVDAATIERARRGDWSVLLTPVKPVPHDWFGDIAGKDILALASAGGQQCPVFAAAGARVACIDASDRQVELDRETARQHGLDVDAQQGYMDDLSRYADESFDLIFHPVSNCYAPDILPVWRECARVLRPGGALLAGFNNPDIYVFDQAEAERGQLAARHPLPYSDLDQPAAQVEAWRAQGQTLEFSHTLQAQIGGQLAAGLMLTDMYEDGWGRPDAIGDLMPFFFATRAIKPRR